MLGTLEMQVLFVCLVMLERTNTVLTLHHACCVLKIPIHRLWQCLAIFALTVRWTVIVLLEVLAFMSVNAATHTKIYRKRVWETCAVCDVHRGFSRTVLWHNVFRVHQIRSQYRRLNASHVLRIACLSMPATMCRIVCAGQDLKIRGHFHVYHVRPEILMRISMQAVCLVPSIHTALLSRQ